MTDGMRYLSVAELQELGLKGARFDAERAILTLVFADREEVWTRVPDGYHVDESFELLLWDGQPYVRDALGGPLH